MGLRTVFFARGDVECQDVLKHIAPASATPTGVVLFHEFLQPARPTECCLRTRLRWSYGYYYRLSARHSPLSASRPPRHKPRKVCFTPYSTAGSHADRSRNPQAILHPKENQASLLRPPHQHQQPSCLPGSQTRRLTKADTDTQGRRRRERSKRGPDRALRSQTGVGHRQWAYEPRYCQGLEERECREAVEGVEFLGLITLFF